MVESPLNCEMLCSKLGRRHPLSNVAITPSRLFLTIPQDCHSANRSRSNCPKLCATLLRPFHRVQYAGQISANPWPADPRSSLGVDASAASQPAVTNPVAPDDAHDAVVGSAAASGSVVGCQFSEFALTHLLTQLPAVPPPAAKQLTTDNVISPWRKSAPVRQPQRNPLHQNKLLMTMPLTQSPVVPPLAYLTTDN